MLMSIQVYAHIYYWKVASIYQVHTMYINSCLVYSRFSSLGHVIWVQVLYTLYIRYVHPAVFPDVVEFGWSLNCLDNIRRKVILQHQLCCMGVQRAVGFVVRALSAVLWVVQLWFEFEQEGGKNWIANTIEPKSRNFHQIPRWSSLITTKSEE